MNGVNKTIRVGLLGPYGFGNLGDAAIQTAMIQHIKEYYPTAQIYGFSLNPEDTLSRHGIESFPIGRMPENPNSLLARIPHNIRYKRWMKILERVFLRGPQEIVLLAKAIKNLDGFNLLIASGGGQLDDYWGGAWQHPYTLFKWSMVARLRGTRFMFVSVGAGPLDTKLSRWFIRQALTMASYRSFRDESSKIFVKEMVQFIRDDPVYPDLAFSLKVANNHGTRSPQKPRPIVGVGPMAYFDPRVWAKKNRDIYHGYLTKLASMVMWLLDRQYDILFLPGNFLQDKLAIDDLREIVTQMGVPYTEERLIQPNISTVEALMSHLMQADMVIASRLHTVLLTTLVTKPVLALSYHDKIDVLMQDTGQAEYCLPIDAFEVDTLIERFTALEANQSAIKEQMVAKINEYRMALDKQYEHIFSQI